MKERGKVRTPKRISPLTETNPELAKEAFGWDPTSVTAGSGKKLQWRCPYGHQYLSTPFKRSSGQGCPICSGRQLLVGFNDLATTHPEIAKEAHGWSPTAVSKGSEKKYLWKCSSNHIYEATVHSRTSKYSGCPFCSGQKVLAGFNDLNTLHPELALQAVGWDPKEIFFRSNRKLQWKCGEGHEWKVSPSSRVFHNSGCPYCSGKRILSGFNDLKTLHPKLALQADGWDPALVSPNSHKAMSWKCSCGYQWSTSPNKRLSNLKRSSRTEFDCPSCNGKVLQRGKNDLQTLFPKLALQADGWDPSYIFAYSKKLLMWKCDLGHNWRAIVSNRTGRDSGCPTCANSGFDPNEKGYLYFLEHPDWEMYQIGITNTPENRIAQHMRLGWISIEIRGPMDGHITQDWETAILRMLRFKGADLANKEIAGKFDGYSEAWSKSKFSATSISQLMRLTEDFELNQRIKSVGFKRDK
jgi:hypothetical protein